MRLRPAFRFQSLRKAEIGNLERSGQSAVIETWVKDGDAGRLSMRFPVRPDPGIAKR